MQSYEGKLFWLLDFSLVPPHEKHDVDTHLLRLGSV